MCAVLDVSRSGYYSWRKRPLSRRAKENKVLLSKVKEVHQDKDKRVYGSPRMTRELRAQGLRCSENRIARLMRKNHIQAQSKRRFKVTTNSKHNLAVAPNLVQQNFHAEGPNQLWTSDITDVWTSEGWLYLAAILDVSNRAIVGWATSSRATAELVRRALTNALHQHKTAPGLIFHSDRGSQFASDAVKELLKQKQITQSMSAKGNCYDNAITESFFSRLKNERVCFEKYQTRQQAHSSLFEYIEIFYNRERRHSAIGFMAPLAFEKCKSHS
jgi:transposase InsO family protein